MTRRLTLIGLSLILSDALLGCDSGSLDTDLPAKSSQFSLTRPTTFGRGVPYCELILAACPS